MFAICQRESAPAYLRFASMSAAALQAAALQTERANSKTPQWPRDQMQTLISRAIFSAAETNNYTPLYFWLALRGVSCAAALSPQMFAHCDWRIFNSSSLQLTKFLLITLSKAQVHSGGNC